MTSDVETNIVAVERIKEYGETEQVERQTDKDIIAYLGSILALIVWNRNFYCENITIIVATFFCVTSYTDIYSRHYFDMPHQ
jgi:hypothetical protein